MVTYEEIAQSVLNGNLKGIKAQVSQAIKDGAKPLEIINKGLIGGMDLVTPLFKTGEMYVPEVMRSAKVMNEGMSIVNEFISDEDRVNKGKIIIGTVEGDLHDIGKNLVALMLESGRYLVIDLGVDVKKETFLEEIEIHQPDIIAMSCLLSTTMPALKETVKYLREQEICKQMKIVVGGAPVTQEYADQIGADGYSDEASTAAELCDSLLN